jgi:cytochrome c
MTMLKSLSLASVLALAASGAAHADDAAAGEKLFNTQCRACHQIGPTAKNAVGPELNGVIGRKAGSAANYTYSAANKNSGLTWDDATFLHYIANPQTVVKGTKMTFAGVKDEEKAKDLLAYLKQFDESGKRSQ